MLLAYLIFRIDKPVYRTELLDLLFDGAENKKTINHLHVMIHSLRKLLASVDADYLSVKKIGRRQEDMDGRHRSDKRELYNRHAFRRRQRYTVPLRCNKHSGWDGSYGSFLGCNAHGQSGGGRAHYQHPAAKRDQKHWRYRDIYRRRDRFG